MKYILTSFLVLLLFILSPNNADAQKRNRKTSSSSASPAFTAGTERIANAAEKRSSIERSRFNGIPFKNIGPTIMSGRVTDIEVDPTDPTHFYVAYASGGLWVTYNNGTSFEPIFDYEAAMTIGDIAIDWNHGEAIWVGTGENNSSRSSYSGVGIYRSFDLGKTWKHMGLNESHHIGKIVLHPIDPNTLWVASLGHLYTENTQGGIYKSSDAGETWNVTYTPKGGTGAIDLVIDPTDPAILYASTWQRTRRAWNFEEGGEGSAILKSIDGGASWEIITSVENGFPVGPDAGRIGLAYYSKDGVTKLYAMIDNQARREKTEETDAELKAKDFKEMTLTEFNNLDSLRLAGFIERAHLPEKFDYQTLKDMIDKGEITPKDIYLYLTDANAALFETPVKGAEVYVWSETSNSWSRTHEEYLDDVVFSYGYYFGLIRVSPADPNHIYIAGVPIIKSKDGGKTWKSISMDNVHPDHHALWINPNNPRHLINGNDGGINISYDDGATYIKCNSPAVGQFYTVNVDNAQPYNIYGGLQDNGVWKGPSYYEASDEWHQSGAYPYSNIMGGDGMQIAIDERDNATVYTGYQFGHYTRLDGNGGSKYIHPMHEMGESPLRWNWQTPIQLSKHNQDILYMASNRFHRSMDKGETWENLSEDLTKGGKKGDVPYGTCSSISESPLMFGLIYVGTDDGNIHRSTDGGNTWKKINQGLTPSNMWVSRVQASNHDKNRVYSALNGYRFDHMNSYIFISDNQGNSWKRIGLNLPKEPVNVVKEDPANEDIIYVGTDNGLYVSVNRGISFEPMMKNIPFVAVHDLVIQEREQDLVIGTHGRSIYVADISNLQQWGEFENNLTLFEIEDISFNSNWGNSWSKWFEVDEPTSEIQLFIDKASPITLDLKSEKGELIKDMELIANIGFNTYTMDLSIPEETALDLYEARKLDVENPSSIEKPEESGSGKFYLQPGEYSLTLTFEGKEVSQNFSVTED